TWLEYSVHHGELKMNKKPRRRGIYTMYHGTTVANARLIIPNGFQRSKVGLLGEGVYVTRDVLKACNYPRNSALSDRVVLKLRVRLGKCKEIRDDKDPLLTTWSKNGFDSAWVPPDAKMASVPSGLQENCVFDPRRVEVVGIPSGQLGATQKPRNCGIYTMYHGTSVASARLIIANGFMQSQGGMLGKGVYVSRDQTKAERYPLNNPASDRVVLELLVRVGRVKRINKDNHPLQYTWNEEGYDTAWVPPNCGMKAVPSGLEEDCVFDPKNIKVVAIRNRGCLRRRRFRR
uniref:Grass carp reovirus (GCRV)-induced gene 2p n=1 Tax=Takifugu rubripes TaxID=31033 RepID=A0A3B5KG06_TAKRU